MAAKNFRSTVLEPTSEFAHGDKLRFTAMATVGEVLKGSFSETTIGEDGVYAVDLQYGKHRIDYKPYEGVWRHFADVEVNADTLATTLQDLALASVPVTDEIVLALQGILADAEAAKISAEEAEAASQSALASIDDKMSEVADGYPSLLVSQMSKMVTVDAATGDDTTADGSIEKPYKTISKAFSEMSSGGDYTVNLSFGDHFVDSRISTNAGRVSFISSLENGRVSDKVASGEEISSLHHSKLIFKKSANADASLSSSAKLFFYNVLIETDAPEGWWESSGSGLKSNRTLISAKELTMSLCGYIGNDYYISPVGISGYGGAPLWMFGVESFSLAGKCNDLILCLSSQKTNIAANIGNLAILSKNYLGGDTVIIDKTTVYEIMGNAQ